MKWGNIAQGTSGVLMTKWVVGAWLQTEKGRNGCRPYALYIVYTGFH